MKHWLVYLFALLLPVHFAWAGAAAYCQHETGAGQNRHFGHHEHVHKASTEPTKSLGDNDCGTCHGGPALLDASIPTAAVPTSSAVVPHRPSPLPTALARAPDRPQWPRLA